MLDAVCACKCHDKFCPELRNAVCWCAFRAPNMILLLFKKGVDAQTEIARDFSTT